LVSLPYYLDMMIEDHVLDFGWRQTHLGRLLGLAMRALTSACWFSWPHNVNVPLALSNLAARGQVGARAHPHHPPPGRRRLPPDRLARAPA
jgi:hypothetical protein